MTQRPLNVVVSYSHKDEAFRQQLEIALKPLVREGAISLWSDHRINAGSEIDHEIQLQLKKADVILLLVSPDFLNSDYCYCYCIEMELAIDRHKNDHSIVIPIILRHADWARTPFSGLKALPSDAKPVFTWEDRDEAWLFVVKGIRGMIENLLPKLVVVEEKSKNQSKTMRESLLNGFGLMRDQYEVHGLIRDVEFGFSALDDDTNGISRGEVCVVSARPNAGLLDFCLNTSKWSSLKHKKTVFFASTRQKAEKISQRILSSLAFVDTHELQRGLIGDDDWSRINMAIKMLSGAEHHLFDEIDFDLARLESALEDQISKKPIDLLVIDGLEFLSDGTNSFEQLATKKLRYLARKYNFAVLVSLTLGPTVDERYDKRPFLNDLEKWHSFQSDADKVLFLYRSRNYGYPCPKQISDCVEVIIAKNSDGPVAVHHLEYREHSGVLRMPDETI